MTSFTVPGDSLPSDDELHSPIIDTVELARTPAHADTVSRFVSLGLTREEAADLVQG